MSAPTDIQKPLPPLGEFAIGWRDVPRRDPSGQVHFDQVPLTLEDALHPQLGDHVVHSTAHDRDCHYLKDVFGRSIAKDPSAVAYHDVGIYWEDEELRHHSPDITVMYGVEEPERNRDTFHCARERTRPRLLLEVTSPNTRHNDVVTKVDVYHRAEVPFYIIVDAREREREARTLRIIGYRYESSGWASMPLDEHGRLWLEEFGFWLGNKDGRVACFDKDGRELSDYVKLSAELEAEMARRAEAEARAAGAEQRAVRAEQRAAAEAEARAAADQRAAAEAKARAEADQRAAKDAKARADAEAQTASEVRARIALEERLRTMEEELRRQRGPS